MAGKGEIAQQAKEKRKTETLEIDKERAMEEVRDIRRKKGQGR